VSLQEILDSLLSGIEDYHNSPEFFEKSIAEEHSLYFSQDINAMNLRDSAGNDSLYKAAVESRNRLWIPRMKNAMEQKPTFFAFGAGHLGGENGVISLLEAQGYRLRPIFDKPITNPLASHGNSGQSPMTAKDYFLVGKNKEKEGEILEAIDNYSQAIILDSQYSEAYTKRAFLKHTKISDFPGALTDLGRAIAINPKNTEFYYSRASLKEEKLKDFQGALSDFDRIIGIKPNHAEAYFSRGTLKNEKLNNPHSALLDFNTHLLLNPQSIGGHIARGILKYSKLKDKSGGVDDIRRANKLARIQNDKEALEKTQQILVVMNTNR
jgi:tetratricopeptide (TPR) repeat protein